MTLERTGKSVFFFDVHIGGPLFAHGKFWTRTDYDAATELQSSERDGSFASCCNFLLDGVEGHKYGKCEMVETVRVTE
jgi:hypothetical protein